MSHIDPSHALTPAGAGQVQTTEPPTTVQIDRAVMVLRALLAAALKPPFDFNLEEAKLIWAGQIGGYRSDVLTAAITEILTQDSKEFPSVGEFAAVAKVIVRDRRDAEEAKRDHTDCDECDGVHWVRVQGRVVTMPVGKDKEPTEVPTTYMRPCERCLPERYRVMITENHQTTCADKPYGCSICGIYRGASSKRKR